MIQLLDLITIIFYQAVELFNSRCIGWYSPNKNIKYDTDANWYPLLSIDR